MRRTQGFTLIELLITATLISLITAFAVPSLIQSRNSANEANTISTMRSAVSVNELYRNRRGRYAAQAEDWVAANLLPSNVSGEIVAGPRDYDFDYVGGVHTYTLTAAPKVPGRGGDRYFFVDQTGVIRFSYEGAANAASPAVD